MWNMWKKLVRLMADILAALSAAVAVLRTAISICTTLLLAAACIFCAVRVATINIYLVVYLAAWDWQAVMDAVSICSSEPGSVSAMWALGWKLLGPILHAGHIRHCMESGIAKIGAKVSRTAQNMREIWGK